MVFRIHYHMQLQKILLFNLSFLTFCPNFYSPFMAAKEKKQVPTVFRSPLMEVARMIWGAGSWLLCNQECFRVTAVNITFLIEHICQHREEKSPYPLAC